MFFFPTAQTLPNFRATYGSLKKCISKIQIIFLIYLLTIREVVGDVYLPKFAVHIEGGISVANSIAKKHNFNNLGQIGIDDHYLFEHPHILKRSTDASLSHHKLLSEEPLVRWFEQQILKKRVKRDLLDTNFNPHFNDEFYKDMWYLHHGGTGGFDMNVLPAWSMGYTGKNIVITILDDGIERTHDDIKENYDPYASYDVNNNDPDPLPRYDPSNENRHGTRCAGEVSAKANNSKCIVGAAYDSRIGGVRMLDGDVYDAVEARSLSFNRSHIDIYSASWGPDDDGRVVDGPGALARKAFTDGIEKGRKGQGSIFVWASGNGGNAQDSCNCDGYTNSIYTLSISSTSKSGTKPWYLEECSSTLATTYSSGAYKEPQIVTSDLHNKCTHTHTGTSASAPLAAGIVALLLEANPRLSWRDVQYITLLTSRPEPMRDGNWITNGRGRKVSLRYGYGLMDAAAMIKLGKDWTNVPPQRICETTSKTKNVPLNQNGWQEELHVTACADTDTEITYLEHVQAKISLKYHRRGDITIYLTSPSGTRSVLLPKRPNDYREGGFDKWAFLSVQFWGEKPEGKWKLELVHAGAKVSKALPKLGDMISWSLVLHGLNIDPEELHGGIRPVTTTLPNCDKECIGGCVGTSAKDCEECKHYKIISTGECVKACPDAYYPVAGLCHSCNSVCKTCRGPDADDCMKCIDGFFLVDDKGSCVTECESAYYLDHVTNTCRSCSNKCVSCTMTASNCTSCPAGRWLDGYTCVKHSKCSNKTYESSTGECESCHSTCLECHGPDDSDCHTCAANRFLKEGHCVENCGQSYYVKDTTDSQGNIYHECRSCSSACKTCNGYKSSQCTSCSTGLQLINGHCVPNVTCTNGQYYDINAMRCFSCHLSCHSCTGPLATDCSSCKSPLVHYKSQHLCLACCTTLLRDSCCVCKEGSDECVTSVLPGNKPKEVPRENVKTPIVILMVLLTITMLILGAVLLWKARKDKKNLLVIQILGTFKWFTRGGGRG